MRISLTSLFVDDPLKAHAFYTEKLGFRSKEFAPEALLAIVVSNEDPDGTALLLEPRGDSFAKDYQAAVFEAGLPIMVFGTGDLESELERLKDAGVTFRDDLEKPEWGLSNLFEDGCGNLLMLQEETPG